MITDFETAPAGPVRLHAAGQTRPPIRHHSG